jgi:hypothetical protein
MRMASYFISPSDLWDMIDTAQAAHTVDMRYWPAKVA